MQLLRVRKIIRKLLPLLLFAVILLTINSSAPDLFRAQVGESLRFRDLVKNENQMKMLTKAQVLEALITAAGYPQDTSPAAILNLGMAGNTPATKADVMAMIQAVYKKSPTTTKSFQLNAPGPVSMAEMQSLIEEININYLFATWRKVLVELDQRKIILSSPCELAPSKDINIADKDCPIIKAALNKSLIKTTPGNLVNIDRRISRAELVDLIAKALELKPFKTNVERFNDVKSADWFAPELRAMLGAGLFKNYSDTKFYPEADVTNWFLDYVLTDLGY